MPACKPVHVRGGVVALAMVRLGMVPLAEIGKSARQEHVVARDI